MCRSIKVLRQTGTIVREEEIAAAALQFVRKIAGTRKPSRANQKAFSLAVLEVTQASHRLLESFGQPIEPATDSNALEANAVENGSINPTHRPSEAF